MPADTAVDGAHQSDSLARKQAGRERGDVDAAGLVAGDGSGGLGACGLGAGVGVGGALEDCVPGVGVGAVAYCGEDGPGDAGGADGGDLLAVGG